MYRKAYYKKRKIRIKLVESLIFLPPHQHAYLCLTAREYGISKAKFYHAIIEKCISSPNFVREAIVENCPSYQHDGNYPKSILIECVECIESLAFTLQRVLESTSGQNADFDRNVAADALVKAAGILEDSKRRVHKTQPPHAAKVP